MKVLIRVDAGPTIGIGHAMRCTTLALELAHTGHAVEIVTEGLPSNIRDRLAHPRIVVGGRQPQELVTDLADGPTAEHPDVIVVDGYHLGPEVERLAAADQILLLIDDNGELPVEHAHLVLNQNLHADRSLYPTIRSDTLMLAGPPYALLRSDVLSLDRPEPDAVGRRLVVTLGGADPARLTRPILTGLLEDPRNTIVVAIGPANLDRSDIENLASASEGRISIDPGDLLTGFRSADIAVIGGGTTLWEVAFLGLPAVAAIVADNQLFGTYAAASRGFVAAVDVRAESDAQGILAAVRSLLDDADRRRQMTCSGRTVFDGRGAARVVEALQERTSAAVRGVS